jgi:4-hydroxy-2-oxoheptanedioate aldolase
MKARLAAGFAVQGAINATGSAAVAEMLGLAGYDFVLVDGEHGPGDHASHLDCLRAIQATPATALFRILEASDAEIKRALDLGFEGILVPAVANAATARSIASACRYPPLGHRGMAARIVRASDYGFAADRYLKPEAAHELFVCVMVETRSAVDDIEAIAAVDGIDCILVGLHDLAGDLGVAGQLEHPLFTDALRRIERATMRSGKILGGIPMPGLDQRGLHERGYRFITAASDVGLLREAMVANLASARRVATSVPPGRKP